MRNGLRTAGIAILAGLIAAAHALVDVIGG